MTDQQKIHALIARDESVTRQFFFKDCRPLFLSIIHNVFSYKVDYNEFVSEFYLYLMENDAYRLKQFEGRSSIYQWMKVVAIRYFVAKRDNMIDMCANDSLSDCSPSCDTVDKESPLIAKMDVGNLLNLMTNRRYVYVIKRLIIDDAEPKVVAKELNVSIDNLYNIKKRAVASLTQIALNEIDCYEKEIRK